MLLKCSSGMDESLSGSALELLEYWEWQPESSENGFNGFDPRKLEVQHAHRIVAEASVCCAH